MKTQSTAAGTVLEALEPRLAPAGVVLLTTTGGVLKVTGDAESNSVRITHNSTTNEWEITDPTASGTTFRLNGVDAGGSLSIDPLKGIQADMKAGDDRLELRTFGSSSGLVLSGALSVKLGDGNDTFVLGSDSFQNIVIGGAVTVDAGTGNDRVDFFANANFGSAVKILGGAGDDEMWFRGVSAIQTYQKGLIVDLGTGSDELLAQVNRLNVIGALTVKGAGGDGLTQEVSLISQYTMVSGLTSIAVAKGATTVNVGDNVSDEVSLGGGLKVTTGAGDDG